jgi:transposase
MARAVSRDVVVVGSRRKAKLEAIVRRPSSPQALVRRARVVLLAHQRWPNAQIAAELGCAVNTVRTWRRRFIRGGVPALCDRPRSGRPESYGPDVRLRIVAAATSVPPEGTSVWTHALIAGHLAGTGISVSQAGRILADLELRPHKVRGWLNRRDNEQFWAQAAAVCDVYLRPPPDTVVVCIDEKTGIQAKYRKYPGRPARRGRLARREFEYVRNGAVSIIAALHVATGQVIAEPITSNNSVTFISFLHRLDQCIDPRLQIHLVMDNGSSHTSGATRAWIAAHPRISVTCTPKHASWLDMAELWFILSLRGAVRDVRHGDLSLLEAAS